MWPQAPAGHGVIGWHPFLSEFTGGKLRRSSAASSQKGMGGNQRSVVESFENNSLGEVNPAPRFEEEKKKSILVNSSCRLED